MSKADNLGGESVGSTENSHACYVWVWGQVSPPPENFEF